MTRQEKNSGALEDRRVVLGVSGSIAAYKGADIASKLTQAGAQVDVVLTKTALEFVTSLTFRSLTHRPVLTKLFDSNSESAVEHVALAERAEVVAVAPATADLIAKAAHGLADDLLTCILLATRAPVVVAPAMDGYMYQNPVTQDNIANLISRGMIIAGPGEGRLASGQFGLGRLAETEDVVGAIRLALGRNGDLAGKRIVVTAGGSREPIDPVRVITNRSSGKMGYAVAEAARDRGANVVLVSSAALRPPFGVGFVAVNTAEEMQNAVQKEIKDADALVMAAAVSDYRVSAPSKTKIKKSDSDLTLKLKPTVDILLTLKNEKLVKVGFAAESHDLLDNARQKLEKKGLDLIAANDITGADSGFASDTNRVILLGKGGYVEELPLMPKIQVAHQILDTVAELLSQRA